MAMKREAGKGGGREESAMQNEGYQLQGLSVEAGLTSHSRYQRGERDKVTRFGVPRHSVIMHTQRWRKLSHGFHV